MIPLDTCTPCQTQFGGAFRNLKDNYYLTSVIGVLHPIANGVFSLCSRRGASSAKQEASVEKYLHADDSDPTESRRYQVKRAPVKQSRPANSTSPIFGIICSLSGTVFLATAVFGILQAAAVHWGAIATITALLAGAGISIGSAGVVPLILGCCLLVGFISARLENRQRDEIEAWNEIWRAACEITSSS